MQKEYKNRQFTNIIVDLLRNKSTVDLIIKKVIVNLVTKKVEKEIYPNPIELSNAEKEQAKRILQKTRIPYVVFEESSQNEEPDSYIINQIPVELDESLDISISSKELLDGIELKTLVTFYSTDSIVIIDGYQYPNDSTRLAFVEVQSDATKGYQVIFIVDLEKKEISGTDFKKIKN